MTNTQATITAVERLLNKKQAVPSKLLRDLLADTKQLYALSIYQRAEIEQIKKGTQLAAQKAEQS